MKLNIIKEFDIISFEEPRYITVFEEFNLLISPDFFQFMKDFPNLTFKGNVRINI